MNDNVWPRRLEDAAQARFIENIDNGRLDAHDPQSACLLGGTGRAGHLPAVRDEQGAKSAADGAAGSGNEGSLGHLSHARLAYPTARLAWRTCQHTPPGSMMWISRPHG